MANVIPILGGGGLSGPAGGGSPVTSQSRASAGSGDSFPDVLSAQGQSAAAVDGDPPAAVARESGGNAVLPGGKKLPPESADIAAPAVTPPAQEAIALATDGLLLPGGTPQAAATALQAPVTAPLPPVSTAAAPVLTTGAEGTPATLSTAATAPAVAGLAQGTLVSTGVIPDAAPSATKAAGPLPVGQQVALPVTSDPAAVPANVAAGASAAVAPDSEQAAAQLVQPGPVAAATLRDAAVPLAAGARRAPEITLPLGGDARTLSESPVRAVAESPAPAPIAIANVGAQFNAQDDAAAAKLAAEILTALTGGETSRPSATTPAPLPTAIISPIALAASDAALPPGARADVTGVLVAQPGEQAWNAELVGRLSLMLRNGTPEANLQLNPPELGRMEVRIATEGDQARVLFTVQGAETRDVIEQALPRLREMLEDSGLSLSRFDVADQAPERRESEGAPLAGDAEGEAVTEDTRGSAPLPLFNTRPDGLVDYYV